MTTVTIETLAASAPTTEGYQRDTYGRQTAAISYATATRLRTIVETWHLATIEAEGCFVYIESDVEIPAGIHRLRCKRTTRKFDYLGPGEASEILLTDDEYRRRKLALLEEQNQLLREANELQQYANQLALRALDP